MALKLWLSGAIPVEYAEYSAAATKHEMCIITALKQ
jgi:hypothetical protein